MSRLFLAQRERAQAEMPGDSGRDSLQDRAMRCFGSQLARRAAGLVLLAGAVGCGGRVAGEEADSEATRDAPRAPPPYAARPPQRRVPPAVSVPSAPPAVSAPSAPPPVEAPSIPPLRAPPRTYDQGEVYAKNLVANVLLANCGLCHGPALTPDQAMARINYIDDMDRLVEVGLIVPLNAAESRLIRLMLDGSMPPAASGYPPVADADIAIVASYIDSPRYWADSSPSPVLDVDAGLPSPAVDAGGAD